jgi:hypothetical protein
MMKTATCDLCDRPIGVDDCKPGVTTVFHVPVPLRRLDVCADCAADLLDMMATGGAGWSRCLLCSSPQPAPQVTAINVGPWNFVVAAGPVGVALLPKATDGGDRLAAAVKQVVAYGQSTFFDGYDHAVYELISALTAAFQVEEPD